MYEIVFYEDDNGKCEMADYLIELETAKRKLKDYMERENDYGYME